MKYEIALQVVREAENALLGNRPMPTHKWLRPIVDTVLRGPWLIIEGGQILIGRMAWVVVTTAIFAIFLSMADGANASMVILPSLFLATGVVYFSAPSRSIAAGIKSAHVEQVRRFILTAARDQSQLQYLGDSVEVVRSHMMQKLGRFNVLLGVAWGILFWYIGSHALDPSLPAEAVGRGLSYSMLGALLFAIVLSCGLCHATAVKAASHILAFAMIEAKAQASASDASTF